MTLVVSLELILAPERGIVVVLEGLRHHGTIPEAGWRPFELGTPICRVRKEGEGQVWGRGKFIARGPDDSGRSQLTSFRIIRRAREKQ